MVERQLQRCRDGCLRRRCGARAGISAAAVIARRIHCCCTLNIPLPQYRAQQRAQQCVPHGNTINNRLSHYCTYTHRSPRPNQSPRHLDIDIALISTTAGNALCSKRSVRRKLGIHGMQQAMQCHPSSRGALHPRTQHADTVAPPSAAAAALAAAAAAVQTCGGQHAHVKNPNML